MTTEHSEDYFLRILFNKIKINEVMTSPPISLSVNAPLSRAHEVFTESPISHLLIVENKEILVGLLTPKYLYKTQSPEKIGESTLPNTDMMIDGDSYYLKYALDRHKLEDIMKKLPFTMGPDDILGKAIHEMEKQNISCIPIVTENNKLYGVLTHMEIVRFITNIINE